MPSRCKNALIWEIPNMIYQRTLQSIDISYLILMLLKVRTTFVFCPVGLQAYLIRIQNYGSKL